MLFTSDTENLIHKAKTQQIPDWELSGEHSCETAVLLMLCY